MASPKLKPEDGFLNTYPDISVKIIRIRNTGTTTSLMKEMSSLLKIFQIWGFDFNRNYRNFRVALTVMSFVFATVILFLNNVVFGYRSGKLLTQINRPFHCVLNFVIIGFLYHFIKNIHRIKDLLSHTELPSIYVAQRIRKYVTFRVISLSLYVITTLVFKLWLSWVNKSYNFLAALLPDGHEALYVSLSVIFDLLISFTIHVSEILIGCFYSCICAGISNGFIACRRALNDCNQANADDVLSSALQTYEKLCSSVSLLEELYSTFIFFWVASIAILVIMWAPEVVLTSYECSAAWRGVIGTFCFGLLITFVDVSMAASSVTIEAQNVTNSLFAILKKTNWETKQKCWATCTKNVLDPPQLSAGKAFYLNRSLICSVFSVISMYTVIIYQIQPQD